MGWLGQLGEGAQRHTAEDGGDMVMESCNKIRIVW